jgi:hypothetical protein
MQTKFHWNPCEQIYPMNLTILLFSQYYIKFKEANAYTDYMKSIYTC